MNISKEILGFGLTCEVRKVQIKDQEYAIKMFNKQCSTQQIEKEIHILSQIKHNNIVHLVDGNPQERFMVTELLEKMDLFDILAKGQKPFQFVSIKYIIQKLTAAIHCVHKLGFVHRDIKLENILLDKQLEIKVCDFGFAESIQGGFVQRSSGTLGYLAPELQHPGLINTEALPITEVFSLGVCLFLLAFAHPPFRSSTKACPYWRLINSNQWTKYWLTVDKNNRCNAEFRLLIQGMLEPDPAKRMTIDQVLEHQFLIGGSKETFEQEVWERFKIE
ncbi:unnamed protein product (macronuclear) [Paramecium tetraurelia]|uniref:Protein kinase domain-containing protein n=1 Tax=Paramecium tetraurelia TaxID=5888 RepID=A0CAE5_PARTE|nr:uncharacterized protein GSPATT00036542001 [Paramecium tetraurelia]CAK67762.1 unnamed protein product [Paramecium tetraurelia]|eukprot:XP_001435159.1 hypothetical protein (macronuclear) [Paramecium tetraurelia strain d4-2]